MLGMHGAQFLPYLAHPAQQHRLAAVAPRTAAVEPHDDCGQHPHVIAETGNLAGQPLQGLTYKSEIDPRFVSHDIDLSPGFDGDQF